jgi:hypothetical protein
MARTLEDCSIGAEGAGLGKGGVIFAQSGEFAIGISMSPITEQSCASEHEI